MISEIVGKRLINVRKDLSRRLGEELSVSDAALKMGLERHTLSRLENGLKGTTESLVIVLRFYRKHGYNQEWILEEDNSNTPLILPKGNQLLAVYQTLTEIDKLLATKKEELTQQLNILGFTPPNDPRRITENELFFPTDA